MCRVKWRRINDDVALTRERRSPAWHPEYVTEINVAYCLLTEDGEPSTFHEPLESSDVTLWMTAMQEKI